MEKLDLKDRKILYALDVDSRQSFRTIGRKVGLSKDVVTSRVKKLQEKGIIQSFITIFDHLRLGFISLRFYFKYQYVTSEIKKEIIAYFVNCKYSGMVSSVEGSYDLVVLMLVKNVTDIYPFWQKALERYGDYFEDRIYSNYVGESIYRRSFLLNEKDDRTESILKRSIEKVEYDDLDLQILKILSHNSRIPTIDIAEELNVNTKTINYRIKKLIKSRLILGFSLVIDLNKLGYKHFKIDFFLKEYSNRHDIIKYIEMNPYLYCVDYTLGYTDLELEFFIKDINHMHQILEDISVNFPKVIKNYRYMQLIEHHKAFVL